jgi:hypothetical protein
MESKIYSLKKAGLFDSNLEFEGDNIIFEVCFFLYFLKQCKERTSRVWNASSKPFSTLATFFPLKESLLTASFRI